MIEIDFEAPIRVDDYVGWPKYLVTLFDWPVDVAKPDDFQHCVRPAVTVDATNSLNRDLRTT